MSGWNGSQGQVYRTTDSRPFGKAKLGHNRAVPALKLPRKLASPLLLLALLALSVQAQTSADAIQARLVGQPLYLRGFWVENALKFDSGGNPKKRYRVGSFTESGIDVQAVKLDKDKLRIDGQRMGVIFPDSTPKRIPLHSRRYNGAVRIEIQAPPDGDYTEALNQIFAPDLAALVPTLPDYWQEYARKHILTPGEKSTPAPDVTAAGKPGSGSDPLFHIMEVTRPVVLKQAKPEFSNASRALKFSGNVIIYLWIMSDGSLSHLRIAQAAGLGLDEQALAAVSKYKFKPATRDGKPVMVDLYVDVNFQILDGR